MISEEDWINFVNNNILKYKTATYIARKIKSSIEQLTSREMAIYQAHASMIEYLIPRV